jgi:hypothetical protein
MRPTELKKRIKAFQHSNEIDSFGQAVNHVAILSKRDRSRLYRYLSNDEKIPSLVADRIRQVTPDPSK